MPSINKRFLLLALIIPVLVVAGAVTATGSQGDLGRAEEVTADQAVKVVKTAMPNARALEVRSTVDTLATKLYVVTGENVDALVDAKTGRLSMLTIADRMPTSTVLTVSLDDAVAAAISFAKDVNVSTPKADPVATVQDHGDTAEYVVIWQRVVNDIRIPDRLSIRVNGATGEVFSLVRAERGFVTPAASKITRSEASSIALATVGTGGAKVADAKQSVVFTLAGEQITVWSVLVKMTDPAGADYAGSVYVNAASGAIVDLPDGS
jgi:hypothetical protein